MSSLESLTKATIYPLDENLKQTGEKIPVLFNPEQYAISKSNQFAAIAIPGRNNPIIQFIKGDAETLSVDLFFDTHTNENDEDVRKKYTDKISDLLTIREHIHAPPVCAFEWGGHSFTGVIEKVDKKFTMFNRDGRPLRATLSITFKQYTDQAEIKKSSPNFTKKRTLVDGDALWLMSTREYGDPDKWKIIADANKIENPLDLKNGSQIFLPPLD